jgi:hypothetical protein
LWKTRTIFDKLNEAYAKYYNPTEHVATYEVIMLFKRQVIYKQYLPKKQKLRDINLKAM